MKNAEGEITKYTKYEIARLVGSRALQLSMGAPFLIKIDKQELEKIKYSPLVIAKREFEAGVLPLSVIRPMPRKERGKEEKQPLKEEKINEEKEEKD